MNARKRLGPAHIEGRLVYESGVTEFSPGDISTVDSVWRIVRSFRLSGTDDDEDRYIAVLDDVGCHARIGIGLPT